MMNRVLLLILTAIYVLHGLLVWFYAIDIPYWDEWLFITPDRLGNLGNSTPFEFVLAPLWESRISWTMLQIWILSKLDGWNFIHVTLINYIMFGGTLALIHGLLKRYSPKNTSYIQYLLILPLLTPWFWEGHGWSIQSHVHISTFLFLLTVHFGFHPQQSSSKIGFATVTGMLGILSWGRGAIFISVFLIIWGLWKTVRFFLSSSPKRELIQYLLVFVALTLCLGFNFFGPFGTGQQLAASEGGVITPLDKRFWPYFVLNTVTMFGFNHASIPLGLACVTGIFTPVILLFYKNRRNLAKIAPDDWRLLTIVLGATAAMAALAGARAHLPLETALSSRYSFANGLLLPFVFVLFLRQCNMRALGDRTGVWIGFIFVFFGYSTTFLTHGYESFYWNRKVDGYYCLSHLVLTDTPGPWRCDSIAFSDIKPAWSVAKNLELSFTRKIIEKRGPESTLYRIYGELKFKPQKPNLDPISTRE